MPTPDPEGVAAQIGGAGFANWYRERKWAENIREGRPYFNGPSRIPPAEKHSPSSLLQCHRKVYYRQANAPAEQDEPRGIFWTGTHFEEDVILPYLQDVVHDADAYVRNSLWVDFEETVDGETIRFKGATDPCIVDRQSVPILPTEVKTKEEVSYLTEPNRHHRAQVHAYMRGLSEKYDREVDEAVVIYGSRKKLNVRTFRVAFDKEFWEDVVDWASRHTEYRGREELPPADPEYGWECQFCDYRHRCGQSEEPYENESPRGFLAGFDDYPRERVVEYLRAHDDARITPTLAAEFPDLVESFEVEEWACPRCQSRYAWDSSEVNADGSSSPVCPTCAERGELTTLRLSS